MMTPIVRVAVQLLGAFVHDPFDVLVLEGTGLGHLEQVDLLLVGSPARLSGKRILRNRA